MRACSARELFARVAGGGRVDAEEHEAAAVEAGVHVLQLPSVRTNRPVLTSSTSDSAIWTTISAWLSRERPPPPSVARRPGIAPLRSTRVARSAGARPKSERRGDGRRRW